MMRKIGSPRTGKASAAPIPEGMREVKHPSVIPLYMAAAMWFYWGRVVPSFDSLLGVPVILSLIAWWIGKKICKPTVTLEPIPQTPPEPTGIPELDQIRAQGEDALRQMAAHQAGIQNPTVREKVGRLRQLTQQIFTQVSEHPEQLPRLRKFSSYYLPTVLKLLATYDDNDEAAALSPNLTKTLEHIEETMDTVLSAFQKQLDALYDDQALDIATDITVLEGMLTQEGLTGSDFGPTNSGTQSPNIK